MTEPTIVTVLRADHAAGLHSEPHQPNQYCADCHPAEPIGWQAIDPQVGWQVTDPAGNVVASGSISHAQATAWVSELAAEAARNEGEQ